MATETPLIVLVDDDAAFRSGIRRTLHSLRQTLPLRMEEAASGAEALPLVQALQPAIILLDFYMPGGSGLAWLQRLASACPTAAVIMITGQGDEQIAVDAMKLGAADYLTKGQLTPEELQRALLGALQKRELAETVRRQELELLAAERQRVMLESLGAACHHLGQPATVIRMYLELLAREPLPEEPASMVQACMKAADDLAAVLRRLQELNQYRTEPYLPASSTPAAEAEPATGDRIVSLEI